VIAQISGTVLSVGPTSAVIEVGGLGVLTLCSPDTLARLRVGERGSVATSLIVREDSLTLYGFASAEERELFELLLTATGVGPKLAQATLAVLRPAELRRAIGNEDLNQLCKVPGIGRKGAQRMVIELKDKISTLPPLDSQVASAPVADAWRDQVSQGLQSLGWSARDAESACVEVEALVQQQPDLGVPALMRAALQTLARR
jgi:holliday junction DNA helicase RuvA